MLYPEDAGRYIMFHVSNSRYLLLHLPVAGCKQEIYSVSLLSKAFRSVGIRDTFKYSYS